ncbi:MAG: uL14 family ribosomal protein [Candidatus Hodgkinia cicadicola]
MIQTGTVLWVGDNSGAKSVRCIRIMGKRSFARIGQLIKAAVCDVAVKSKIKRGQLVNAIVIRDSKFFSRGNRLIKFNQSAVSLLNSTFEPIASRIFGPIPSEFRIWHSKIFNIASSIV